MNTITIKRDDSGQRLDKYLRKVLPNVPLSKIYKSIRTKRIKVNNKRTWADYSLQEKDQLKVYLPRGDIQETEKPDLSALKDTLFFKKNFHILYEDKEILALNKPPSLVVHPGSKVRAGQSLIDLVHSYLGAAEAATFQPSLVHRLDKQTSGVILVAKTAETLRYLTTLIREGKIKKEYTALVVGLLKNKSGVINQRLLRTRDAARGGKVRVADESAADARESTTKYKVVKEFTNCSVVSVLLETGRTHQIRVHMDSIGHPVVGDTDYGKDNINKYFQKNAGLKRQFLHAHTLIFKTRNGKSIKIMAPLPEDLESVLNFLGNN